MAFGLGRQRVPFKGSQELRFPEEFLISSSQFPMQVIRNAN